MSNYPQEGFIPMEQYMAQFTGEEPAQVREHNRVVELEREVARLRDIVSRYVDMCGRYSQRVEELDRELTLVVKVAYETMDAVILDRCALGSQPDDWTVDGVSIGDVRKVIAMYDALNSE